MTWWDSRAGRYRSSLPHKILHVWCWPLIRWTMFRLPSETAHHMAIRGIWFAGRVERVWGWVVTASVIAVLILIRLLMFLPCFTYKRQPD